MRSINGVPVFQSQIGLHGHKTYLDCFKFEWLKYSSVLWQVEISLLKSDIFDVPAAPTGHIHPNRRPALQ
jgi:hypothetical protein